MTTAHASPVVLRAALGAAGVAGVIALVLILTSSGSGTPSVPGMPASVAATLGGDPTTLTLHGDVLELDSAPDIQRLEALETQIAHQSYVAEQYGLVTWLDGQFTRIGRSVTSHTTQRETRANLLVRAGATGGLDLNDSELTSTLIFGTGVNPLSQIRWLVPTGNTLRIFVRTRGSMSRTAVARALRRLVSQSGLNAVPSVSPAA